MHLQSFFLYYLTLWRPLGYFLSFVGLTFEGDVTLFTVAFLTREGFFDIGDMIIVVLLSIFVSDILWYMIGKNVIDRFPKFKNAVDKVAKPFDRHLLEQPAKTLTISKFTYGVHHAVLIRSGMSKMDLKKFIKNDIISIIIWVSAIGGLGYFSSLSLEYLRQYLRFAEVSLLFGLILFFAVERILKFLSKKGLRG